MFIHRFLLPTIRILSLAGFLFGGSYYLTMLRTSGFGLGASDFAMLLAVSVVCVMLPCALVLLGLKQRRIVFGAVAVGLCCLSVAEAFGRAQEVVVVHRYGAAPTQEVLVSRWWPFTHHAISYRPSEGWDGCD